MFGWIWNLAFTAGLTIPKFISWKARTWWRSRCEVSGKPVARVYNASYSRVAIQSRHEVAFTRRGLYVWGLKGNCHEQFNLKKTAWTFQIWFKAASMQGKTARIWRVFGGERDHYRQKSRFRERKVARKPGMLPQTTLLKCTRSSWQFPFEGESQSQLRMCGVCRLMRLAQQEFLECNWYTWHIYGTREDHNTVSWIPYLNKDVQHHSWLKTNDFAGYKYLRDF